MVNGQITLSAPGANCSPTGGARRLSRRGRPSIPPEKLLRALLLQAFYSIRSERQLMEQLDYNLLFRWFVGSVDGSGVGPTVFSKNRDRLLEGDIGAKFLAACWPAAGQARCCRASTSRSTAR
jgi:transposase